MVKVNYEEWFNNRNNADWSGWKDVKYIESTVGKSRYCDNWLQHSICFLNNYLMEKYVKDFLGLDYYGDDHLEWREGKGNNLPDFIDNKTKKTYEFKQMKDFMSLETIPERDWHNADVRLIYTRIDGRLYMIDRTESRTKMVFVANFRPFRIQYKELTIYERICTEESEVCQ